MNSKKKKLIFLGSGIFFKSIDLVTPFLSPVCPEVRISSKNRRMECEPDDFIKWRNGTYRRSRSFLANGDTVFRYPSHTADSLVLSSSSSSSCCGVPSFVSLGVCTRDRYLLLHRSCSLRTKPRVCVLPSEKLERSVLSRTAMVFGESTEKFAYPLQGRGNSVFPARLFPWKIACSYFLSQLLM